VSEGALAVDAVGDVFAAGSLFHSEPEENDFDDFLVMKISGANVGVLWRTEIDEGGVMGPASGFGSDTAASVAVDQAGNAVAGGTLSGDFAFGDPIALPAALSQGGKLAVDIDFPDDPDCSGPTGAQEEAEPVPEPPGFSSVCSRWRPCGCDRPTADAPRASRSIDSSR
jgi:hypothetical protein